MILPTELFSYDKDTRTFCACASTGPLHSMFRPGDKVPELLMLESYRTGVVLPFDYLSKREHECELLSWTYYNYNNDISVEIFND